MVFDGLASGGQEAPSVTGGYSFDPVAGVSPAPVPSTRVVIDGGRAAQVGDGLVARFEPSLLQIPSLGVSAQIVDVPLEDGVLEIPAPSKVGRWDGGAQPGDLAGTMLLAGHVSGRGVKGALYPLSTIGQGAEILVSDSRGCYLEQYRVVGLEQIHKQDLPAELFAEDGERLLRVITCGGQVITRSDGSRHYEDNVIVTAALSHIWDGC
jgi:hypothetical protein